jgi:hypothetical protein
MDAFDVGEQVVLRYLCGQSILHAWPMTVVEDGLDRVVLWIAADAVCRGPAEPVSVSERGRGEWQLADRSWSEGAETVMLSEPGRAHAIWLFWDGGGEFTGWYVNLEDPWQRTRLGFDSRDHLLDLRIEPDGSWSWLDEEDLEEAKKVGLFSEEEAAAIQAEGERVLADWPFPTGWEGWRPEPEWPLGRLPQGWDIVADAGAAR